MMRDAYVALRPLHEGPVLNRYADGSDPLSLAIVLLPGHVPNLSGANGGAVGLDAIATS